MMQHQLLTSFSPSELTDEQWSEVLFCFILPFNPMWSVLKPDTHSFISANQGLVPYKLSAETKLMILHISVWIPFIDKSEKKKKHIQKSSIPAEQKKLPLTLSQVYTSHIIRENSIPVG